MNRISLALVSAAFVALAVGPSSAADYTWTFTSAGQDIHGTLTTDSALGVAGNVIGIGGTVNGDTITGLVPNPTPGSTSGSPDGLFNFDNKLQPSSDLFLTNPGLLFTTQSGTEYNLYSLDVVIMELASTPGSDPSGPPDYNLDAAFNGQYGTSLNGDFTIAPTSLVPEPSSWILMLLGFAGLGAMARRVRAHVTSAAA